MRQIDAKSYPNRGYEVRKSWLLLAFMSQKVLAVHLLSSFFRLNRIYEREYFGRCRKFQNIKGVRLMQKPFELPQLLAEIDRLMK